MSLGQKNKYCADCGTLIWSASFKCKSCSSKGFARNIKIDKIAKKHDMTICELLKYFIIDRNLTHQETAAELGITSIYYHLKKCGIKKTGKWQRGSGIASNGWYSGSHNARFVCVDGREMFESHYIIEQYLERKLESDEVVHHVNGDRLDNRLENLELMTKSSHTILHNTGKSRQGIPHPKWTSKQRQTYLKAFKKRSLRSKK